MKKKFTGIVIAEIPYGKDNLITLCTAEEGLVNIVVKRSTNERTRFTYAKQIFTFGYFYVRGYGDMFNVLERLEIVDTFENIKQNPIKRIEATNLIFVGKEVAQFGDADAALLLELMTALKTLNYNDLPQNLVLAKYMSAILKGIVKNINFSACTLCGEKFQDAAFFESTSNNFVCADCTDKGLIKFSKLQIDLLKLLIETEYSMLKTIKTAEIDEFLKQMLKIFNIKVSQKFKFYAE
ncbi:MAG: DNA repair protein RecO [Clostridia bacterium]